MNDGSDRWQELDSVLDRVLDGIYNDGDLRRLNEILRDDVEACRRYVLYMELHGRLAWGDGLKTEVEDAIDLAAPKEIGYSADELRQQLGYGGTTGSKVLPPIVIQTSPAIPSSFSPFGSFLFSYAVAAVTVVFGLLLGWVYQVSVSEQQFAHEKNGRQGLPTDLQPPESKMVFVGQITGMFNPQWSDRSTAAVEYAYVPLGRRYALASGLMEISYNTGAKVILQGPCVYEVDSKTSGYLEVGRVTAKVEKRGAGEKRKADAPTSDNPSPLPVPSSPLFSVRTPTAVITDLGTEFGVEVDESGASEAHVFRGRVEMRVAGDNATAISLEANDSGRVRIGGVRVAEAVRQTPPKTSFVHDMPRTERIAVFNTGVGLEGGDADPHWQIVSRSDEPKFEPRPAIVRGMKNQTDYFLEDDPNRSQWLSLLAGDRVFPEDVVFVFRTTFDLTGVLPSTAVVQGKFLADDHVVAIRLNGRRLPVPVHRDGGPFLDWTSFRIASGFVKGKNVLEFDVLNANPYVSPDHRRTLMGRMSFRAELEGAATRDPGLTGNEVSRKLPRSSPPGDKKAAMDARKRQLAAKRVTKETPSTGER